MDDQLELVEQISDFLEERSDELTSWELEFMQNLVRLNGNGRVLNSSQIEKAEEILAERVDE